MEKIKIETLMKLPESIYSQVVSMSVQNGKDGYVYVTKEIYNKIMKYMEKNI